MEASEVSLEHVRNGYCRLSATIRSKLLRRAFRLYYSFDSRFSDCVTPYGDPLVAALLPICAYHGEDLIVHAPVTRDLMQQIPRILGKFKEFYPEFTYIQTVADSYEDTPLCPDEHRRSASFLSLGVDSLYTLFHNKDAIDLVIVNAFDQLAWEDSYLSMVLEGVRATLERLDSAADILVVRSNIFELSQGLVEWGEHFHGACLASIAHAFSGGIDRVFIAATYPLEHLYPWGSHPELDPLWSTSAMQIVHDSPIRRLDKIIEMAETPELFEHLRVCYHHFRRKFNCGWCSKCTSAALSLKTAGVLGFCRTLPPDIKVDRLPYQVDKESSVGWIDVDRWICALGDDAGDAPLKAALLEAKSKWNDPSIRLFPEKIREMIELAAKGKYPECSNLADLLLEMDPYDPIANYYRGLCLLWQDGKLSESATFFEKASDFGYDEFLCQHHSGLANLLSGCVIKGGSECLSALRLDSGRFVMRLFKDSARLVLRATGLYQHFLTARSDFSSSRSSHRGPQSTAGCAHASGDSAGSGSQHQQRGHAVGEEHGSEDVR